MLLSWNQPSLWNIAAHPRNIIVDLCPVSCRTQIWVHTVRLHGLISSSPWKQSPIRSFSNFMILILPYCCAVSSLFTLCKCSYVQANPYPILVLPQEVLLKKDISQSARNDHCISAVLWSRQEFTGALLVCSHSTPPSLGSTCMYTRRHARCCASGCCHACVIKKGIFSVVDFP